MYYSDFTQTSGPTDLVEGDLRVQWCLTGASVATSSFCNSGGALKLDSATDDPLIWISVGNAGCTAIEIAFKYSQFSASQTVVKYGTTNATTLSCSGLTPSTLGALGVTGGVCQPVTVTIPLGSAKGICLRFDHGANANAIMIDDLEIRRVGCCTTGGHGCCTTGGPGCSDGTVAACVCAIDPFCCESEWDAQCIAGISQYGCGSCAGGGACAGDRDGARGARACARCAADGGRARRGPIRRGPWCRSPVAATARGSDGRARATAPAG